MRERQVKAEVKKRLQAKFPLEKGVQGVVSFVFRSTGLYNPLYPCLPAGTPLC